MSHSKYILLLTTFLISLLAGAQDGRRIYILSTGDTTLVVNKISGSLHDKEAQFLFNRFTGAPRDSIFLDLDSKYKSLEEAAFDVNRLLNKVTVEQILNKKEGNEGLAFRLSQIHRSNLRKEAIARNIADSVMSKDTSVQDLAALYLKFGNRPTYYVNGTEVSEEATNLLRPSDILKRTMKVADTASGNPNGEIWYDVTDKAMLRINYYNSTRVSKDNVMDQPLMVYPLSQMPKEHTKVEKEYAPSAATTSAKKPKKAKKDKDAKMEEVEIKIEGRPSVKTFKPAK